MNFRRRHWCVDVLHGDQYFQTVAWADTRAQAEDHIKNLYPDATFVNAEATAEEKESK